MILLDTHVVIWLALEPNKISSEARLAIEEARRKSEGIAISDITLFEISTIERKGRVRLEAGLGAFLSEVEARFVIIALNGRICVKARELPAAYPKDPADRIIGATALVQGFPLVTADEGIRHSKALKTIW